MCYPVMYSCNVVQVHCVKAFGALSDIVHKVSCFFFYASKDCQILRGKPAICSSQQSDALMTWRHVCGRQVPSQQGLCCTHGQAPLK